MMVSSEKRITFKVFRNATDLINFQKAQNMVKFFIEIEFKTDFDNKYWFPLFTTADSKEQAEENTRAVITALNEHYKVTRCTRPKLYATGTNSQYIDDYVQHGLTGNLALLQMNVWRFKDFLPSSNMTFDERLELIDVNTGLTKSTIATTIERHEFPVRQYPNPGGNTTFDDFLLINIVEPLKA